MSSPRAGYCHPDSRKHSRLVEDETVTLRRLSDENAKEYAMEDGDRPIFADKVLTLRVGMPLRSGARKVLLVLLGVALAVGVTEKAMSYAAGPEESGKALFAEKCKACHTIGGGRTLGPDLKGVTLLRDPDWLARFIREPDKVIAEKNPIAVQLLKDYNNIPMPNMGLSAAETASVVVYLASVSGQPPAPSPTSTTTSTTTTTPVLSPSATPPPAATPQAVATTITANPLSVSAASGRDLFTGREAFRNGGAACVGCHNMGAVGLLGGGTVGKDLTTAYANFGGTGIGSLLKTTPFPMMKEVYTTRPLTDEEISSVVAFLKDAQDAPPTSSQNPTLFFIIGGAGALIIVGLFHLLWRGRLGGVRRPLVKGVSK